MSDSVKPNLLVPDMVKNSPTVDSTPTNATTIQASSRLDMPCFASGYHNFMGRVETDRTGRDRSTQQISLHAMTRGERTLILDSRQVDTCGPPQASPTAGGPASGASALRAYALPFPAARISGQAAAPAGALVAGGDADPRHTIGCNVALNINAACGVHDTAADFDAEADAGTAGATGRGDLHVPGAIETAGYGGRAGGRKRHGRKS
jgi:hypothetical protein